MPRLLGHITRTKQAPPHRSCDGGRRLRDLVLDSVGEGKDCSRCTSTVHAKARSLSWRGSPQSWAKGFFSPKLLGRIMALRGAWGLGQTGYPSLHHWEGNIRRVQRQLILSLDLASFPSCPKGMASGRVSRVSRAGQVPWYRPTYVIRPLVFTGLWTKVGRHMARMVEVGGWP